MTREIIKGYIHKLLSWAFHCSVEDKYWVTGTYFVIISYFFHFYYGMKFADSWSEKHLDYEKFATSYKQQKKHVKSERICLTHHMKI
jgi:hypothetical protein